MTTWVVRHACAGDKDEWSGPDDERPLDAVGELQADALGELLARASISTVLSSPTRRCVATVEPLARRIRLPIEEAPQLQPDARVPLVELLDDARVDGAVLCTHGEVMEPALRDLRRAGIAVIGDHDDTELLLKGAAWQLARVDARWQLHLMVPVRAPTCLRHG